MSRSGSRLTTLGRGSFIATSIGTWRSESWPYSCLFRMLMCRRSSRGFAVVFAEDVPDVSTSVTPPGEFKRILCIVKRSRTCPSSRFMGGPLPELHHLRQRQPKHNLVVDTLLLPSFYGECFIIDSLFLGSPTRFAAFVSLLRAFFQLRYPSAYAILNCRCFGDYCSSRLVRMISPSTGCCVAK